MGEAEEGGGMRVMAQKMNETEIRRRSHSAGAKLQRAPLRQLLISPSFLSQEVLFAGRIVYAQSTRTQLCRSGTQLCYFSFEFGFGV